MMCQECEKAKVTAGRPGEGRCQCGVSLFATGTLMCTRCSNRTKKCQGCGKPVTQKVDDSEGDLLLCALPENDRDIL